MDQELALVFVWYHETNFVYNFPPYPFWHNVLYLATSHDAYLVYYVDNESSPLPQIPQSCKRLKCLNFKHLYSEEKLTKLKNFKLKCNKIDYMKMQLVIDQQRHFRRQSFSLPSTDVVDNDYKYILFLDMDCSLPTPIDWTRMEKSCRHLEPFFDSSVDHLIEYQGNLWDSYLENYAMLINRHNTKPIEFDFEENIRMRYDEDEDACFMLLVFHNYIKAYYQQHHKFEFPQKFSDLKFINSIHVKFRRGGSWKQGILEKPTYNYIFDPNQKPPFSKSVRLDLQLGEIIDRQIDFMGRTTTKFSYMEMSMIQDLLQQLQALNYDFKCKFKWSNKRQKYINLYAALQDCGEVVCQFLNIDVSLCIEF